MATNVIRRSLTGAHRILRLSPAPYPPSTSSSPTFLKAQNRFASASSFSGDGSVETHFSDEESKKRLFNRLLYRSRQRGFLELDLVLGKWVEEHIHTMDVNGVKALIHVLDLENPDLWKWLTDQEPPPELVKLNPVFAAVREKIKKNLDSYSAPETRALSGQQWVRGWDDSKKGRDAPISGNQ